MASLLYLCMQNNQTKNCCFCGKNIRGRSDKRFCDDYCRNNHHNKYKHENEDNEIFRSCNKILARNRNILSGLFKDEYELVKIDKAMLLEMGFVFRYFTHIERGPSGVIYQCCYDYVYLSINTKEMMVARMH